MDIENSILKFVISNKVEEEFRKFIYKQIENQGYSESKKLLCVGSIYAGYF